MIPQVASWLPPRYYRLKCGHDESPIGASKCIMEQIGKTNDRRHLPSAFYCSQHISVAPAKVVDVVVVVRAAWS